MQKILQRNERMSQMLELISHIIKTKYTHPVPILLIQTFSHSYDEVQIHCNFNSKCNCKSIVKIYCKSKCIIFGFDL